MIIRGSLPLILERLYIVRESDILPIVFLWFQNTGYIIASHQNVGYVFP
jgi:hypothetical protein